jgi:hypothetical protein
MRPLHVAFRERRHAWLFVSLLASIAAGPLLEITRFGARWLEAFLALNLIAAILPDRDGGRRWFLLALVLAALLIRGLPVEALGVRAAPLALVLWSMVALFAAYRALRYSVSSVEVDSAHVLAALNAYLLVGIFGGAMCVALDAVAPGAFNVQGKPFDGGIPLPDAIYFSFVTLATLGYGDIVPVTPIARGYAVFEAVFGQLYLAVLVGRLVGLRTAAVQAREAPR